MSLRRRLLLAAAIIAAVLIGADAVLAVNLRSYLVQRVDGQLASAVASFGRGRGPDHPFGDGPARPGGELSELFVQVRDLDGNVISGFSPGLRASGDAPPRLTAEVIARHAAPDGDARPFTVAAETGSLQYRATAVVRGGGRPAVLIVAVSLREVRTTLGRLLAVEGVATLSVLGILALIGWWVLRLGLHPLDEMAATADAIAGGDLSRRVTLAESGTEVGRLGLALNAMLSEIEVAFSAKEASEQRLRRFIADASHELRTPLTSIRGYLELWRHGGLRDEGELADALRRTEQEATRMGRLVEDLLLLARLDQGRPLEEQAVDLSALVRDAVTDARAVEPERPVSLQPDTPVLVTGDADRLHQVIANLLANARIHTPPQTPVDVAVRTDAASAVVEVRDHGPGIEPGAADKVFERFFRVDPSRVRSGGGSGLGLSIVASIVAAHRGMVVHEPTPGGGATFRITLPRRVDDGLGPAPAGPVFEAPAVGGATG